MITFEQAMQITQDWLDAQDAHAHVTDDQSEALQDETHWLVSLEVDDIEYLVFGGSTPLVNKSTGAVDLIALPADSDRVEAMVPALTEWPASFAATARGHRLPVRRCDPNRTTRIPISRDQRTRRSLCALIEPWRKYGSTNWPKNSAPSPRSFLRS